MKVRGVRNYKVENTKTYIDPCALGFALKQIRYKVFNFRNSRSYQSDIFGFVAHLVSSELGSLSKLSIFWFRIDRYTMAYFMRLHMGTEAKSKSFGCLEHCLAVPPDRSEIQDSCWSWNFFEILANIL